MQSIYIAACLRLLLLYLSQNADSAQCVVIGIAINGVYHRHHLHCVRFLRFLRRFARYRWKLRCYGGYCCYCSLGAKYSYSGVWLW